MNSAVILCSLIGACGIQAVPAMAAQPAEYHVAPGIKGAADYNPGTLERPWRTIGRAAAAVRAGDTVFIHAGVYPESVSIKNSGTEDAPITFKAYADDTVILDGADTIAPSRWRRLPGSQNIYALAVERDPGEVLVDGKPVYPKVDPIRKTYPRTYKLGTLTDADKDVYQFAAGRLLLNLGGDSPAKHSIRVPVRTSAFDLGPHCILSGIHASHYSGTAITVSGDDATVEDCQVTDSGSGIGIGGWNRRGVIVRRNTVINAQGNGIGFVDRPTQCLVEDNLVIRCTLNAAKEDIWAGGIKMNSASDITIANNVVLECGNPDTDGGVDGPALWGDINIDRVMYVGNTCVNNKEAGIYVEFAMDDTRAYFNTSYRNGHGITCRASERGVFMRNLVLENRGSGLAVWSADAPFTTTDNLFAHNLVRDCSPLIRLQVEQPEFADYNTYWPGDNGFLADGVGGKKYNDLAGWIAATGHDVHSKIQNARPADVGLDTVTFRVPDSSDPTQKLMMVGNSGCEYEDPAGQDLLPYFWRPGSGDGVDHVFSYAVYNGLEGGTGSQGYAGAGGTVALQADSPASPDQPKIAHGGLRYLEIDGQKPIEMCGDGLGFWSPSLPARSGDTFDVSFYARGVNLSRTPGNADVPPGTPIAAFVEFTDATGQHRHRITLPGVSSTGKMLGGTFGWTALTAAVKVPDGARRMRVFLGLLPGTGQLMLDDITIKVR